MCGQPPLNFRSGVNAAKGIVLPCFRWCGEAVQRRANVVQSTGTSWCLGGHTETSRRRCFSHSVFAVHDGGPLDLRHGQMDLDLAERQPQFLPCGPLGPLTEPFCKRRTDHSSGVVLQASAVSFRVVGEWPQASLGMTPCCVCPVLCGADPSTLAHWHWKCEAHRSDRDQFLLECVAAIALRNAKAGDLWWHSLLMHHPAQCIPAPSEADPEWENTGAASVRISGVQEWQRKPRLLPWRRRAAWTVL